MKPSFPIFLFAAIWGCLIPWCQGGTERPPNVVVILADDHRYDWMGHKGKAFMKTPHLDELAAEGISFANAFACSGVCSPSRASILTGRYADRASAPEIIWCNNSFLHSQTPFPQLLHKAGYATAYIGKLHLGDDEKPKPGFDYWAGFPFVGDFSNQPVWINGEKTPGSGFTDDRLAKLAADWIAGQGKDGKPFFLMVGLKATHIPFQYPERMKAELGDTVFAEPETYHLRKPGLGDNHILAEKFKYGIPAYGNFQEWVRSYSRLALTIDGSVGTIVEALKKSGQFDNTLFIYTSDQGYSLGEFGLCEKHYAYEQVMRIPMVVRYPRWIPEGTKRDQMVLTVDLAPTILDACGVAAPEGMDGRSWKPLFASETTPWRDDFLFQFWHYFGEIMPPMLAVRTDRYKLIEYELQPVKELYDLKNDPLEKENLYGKVEIAPVQADMEARLARLKKESGWLPREIRPLESFALLGPVPKEKEKELETLLSRQTSPEPVQIGKETFTWKPCELGAKGTFDAGNFKEGDIFYIAVPFVRNIDYDPYITLEFYRAGIGGKGARSHFPMAALFQDNVIWQNTPYRQLTGQPEAIFNDQCNYPLPDKRGMALFRCVAPATPGPLQAEIVAPKGAVTPVY